MAQPSTLSTRIQIDVPVSDFIDWDNNSPPTTKSWSNPVDDALRSVIYDSQTPVLSVYVAKNIFATSPLSHYLQTIINGWVGHKTGSRWRWSKFTLTFNDYTATAPTDPISIHLKTNIAGDGYTLSGIPGTLVIYPLYPDTANNWTGNLTTEFVIENKYGWSTQGGAPRYDGQNVGYGYSAGPFWINYSETLTDYYTDYTDSDPANATSVYMPDWSEYSGVTFPGAINNALIRGVSSLFADDELTCAASVLRGVLPTTYTVDTTQSTLAGFGLFGDTSVTVDTTQAASGESLILVFGTVGEITSDFTQIQTVKVIQDLFGQDSLTVDVDQSATALLNIVIGNQSMTSDVDMTPLAGFALYGASALEGDGFLMSDALVIRLDDYFLVNIPSESRTIKTAPELRFPLVEPETRNESILAEHKYYLVEPETRQYKITANKATQIGPRTRRLEQ